MSKELEQKQIEEMVRDVCKLGISCNDCNAQGECVAEKYALRFYNAGYRKQSEVIDEFVKMLKDTAMTKWDYHEAVDVEEIDRIAAKMKGE